MIELFRWQADRIGTGTGVINFPVGVTLQADVQAGILTVVFVAVGFEDFVVAG